MNKLITSTIILILTATFSLAGSDIVKQSPKDILNNNPLYTIEVQGGAEFSTGKSYLSTPIDVTLSRKMYEVQNAKWYDGFAEAFIRNNNSIVNQGAETSIHGLSLGGRYNFCSIFNNIPVIPFVESSLGVAFTNSRHNEDGFAFRQDTNLFIENGVGVVYDINDRWFARFGVYDKKYFNNSELNDISPKIGIGYIF